MLVVVLYHSMLFYTGNWFFTVIKPVKVLNYIDYITTFHLTLIQCLYLFFVQAICFFYQKKRIINIITC